MRLESLVFFLMFALEASPLTAALKIGGNTIPAASGPEFDSLTSNGTNALRKEIFEKMIAAGAGEVFEFRNVGHASRNFDLRDAVVKTMEEIQDKTINFGSGTKAPPQWSQVSKFGARSQYFKPNAGLSPSEAIKKVETGETLGECVGCIDACLMIASRRTLGDTEFDRQLNGKNVVVIDDKLFPVSSATNKSIQIPGDALFMDNHDYQPNNGPWQGENVIYCGGGKFSGLAVNKQDEAELRATLYEHYRTDTGRLIDPDARVTSIKFTEHVRVKILAFDQ